MVESLIVAGVDIGSATTKAVIMQSGRVLGSSVFLTGADNRVAAEKTIDTVCTETDIERSQIKAIVATGYGRVRADFSDRKVTEIACHAKGAKWLLPKTGAVIDVGGQDSKAIIVDELGNVEDFVMNDKCAAGTGKFIEVICNALNLELDDAGRISKKSREPSTISSMCAVFAETEIVSLVAEGEFPANIIAGVHVSVANRVASMASRLDLSGRQIAFTGGVAKNSGMQRSLGKMFKEKILVPEEPQIVGAIGAALFAGELGDNYDQSRAKIRPRRGFSFFRKNRGD